MPILPTRKTQSQIQARAQDIRFYPEVRPHQKGVLFSIEDPTKGQIFSNRNPPQPDHKGQGKSFSQICSQEQVIQTSWGRPQLWRLPNNLNLSRNLKVPRTTSSHKRCLQQAQEMRKRGERKTKSEGHKHKPHTNGAP
jgi:hypothetical protein